MGEVGKKGTERAVFVYMVKGKKPTTVEQYLCVRQRKKQLITVEQYLCVRPKEKNLSHESITCVYGEGKKTYCHKVVLVCTAKEKQN